MLVCSTIVMSAGEENSSTTIPFPGFAYQRQGAFNPYAVCFDRTVDDSYRDGRQRFDV